MESSIDPKLWERVRDGERVAVAQFLSQFRPLIRQRFRNAAKPALRAVTDTEDIWSTLARRMDRMCAMGAMQVASEDAFWVLVGKVLKNAIVDRARVLDRLDRATSEDEPFVRAWRDRLVGEPGEESDDAATVKLAMAELENPVDRDILTLWLTEHSHAAIGDILGLEADHVRVRWHRIRKRLQGIFDEGANS